MLSSKDGLFDKAKGRIVGADDYLTKPFSKAELFEALERFAPRAIAPDSTAEQTTDIPDGGAYGESTDYWWFAHWDTPTHWYAEKKWLWGAGGSRLGLIENLI